MSDTRKQEALNRRTRAARKQLEDHPHSDLPATGNGDDDTYPNAEASFTKLLEHNGDGVLSSQGRAAYEELRDALSARDGAALNEVPLANQTDDPRRVFVNPQSSWSFEVSGPDVVQLDMPAAPSLSSREAAAEMIEVYGAYLLRDVPFSEYASDPTAQLVAEVLTRFGRHHTGPKEPDSTGVSRVTPELLYRGDTAGDRTGHFLSQFLLQPIFPLFPSGCAPFVGQIIGVGNLDLQHLQREQKHANPASPAEGGHEFLDTMDAYVAVQNGRIPKQFEAADYETTKRFVTRGRDLGGLVHVDAPYEAYLNVLHILLFRGASFERSFPYYPGRTGPDAITNQSDGHTMGPSDVFALVGRASVSAFKAAWANKWLAHRRLRPEAMAARVHVALGDPLQQGSLNKALDTMLQFDLHPDLVLLGRPILEKVAALGKAGGTLLLPQMYPEGSPAHPAYPSGHATIAGACTTVLKAFLDDRATIPQLPPQPAGSPLKLGNVVPSSDGTTLEDYTGPALTIGGELDKLASNIAHGRDFGGVHFRSDGDRGIALGEQVALRLLQEHVSTYVESGFSGFELTLRSGRRVRVDADGVQSA